MLAASVARDARIAYSDHDSSTPRFGLAAWLQGSTDEGLRAQLVGLFATHRPDVIGACLDDQEECTRRIRQWLEAHANAWLLVVEDAGSTCTGLWECIPPGVGRLLLTSQERLHDERPELKFSTHLELQELGMAQSL